MTTHTQPDTTTTTPHGIPAGAVDHIRRIAWQELLDRPVTTVDDDTEAWLTGEVDNDTLTDGSIEGWRVNAGIAFDSTEV